MTPGPSSPTGAKIAFPFSRVCMCDSSIVMPIYICSGSMKTIKSLPCLRVECRNDEGPLGATISSGGCSLMLPLILREVEDAHILLTLLSVIDLVEVSRMTASTGVVNIELSELTVDVGSFTMHGWESLIYLNLR
ncbi:hypothetical protein AC1031_013468 [Aphanomyces cochlioides]|nr:hypothetical protein AC1031_013468 [Aphanomyces cochlioides]